MWSSLQILIGCLPLIIMAVILILRKKLIIIPAFFLIMIVALCGYSLVQWDLSGSNESMQITSVSKENMIDMVNGRIADGNYVAARKLVNKLYKEHSNDAEVVMLNAKVSVLEGSISSAKALFDKAVMIDADIDIDAKEKEYFEKLKSGAIMSPMDAGVVTAEINYLTSAGKNPADYGYNVSKDEIKESAQRLGEFQEVIANNSKENVKNSGYSEDESKIIDNIYADIEKNEEQAASYNEYSETDEKVINIINNDIVEAEENVPEVFADEEIDKMAVVNFVLLDDDKGLIEYAQNTDSKIAYLVIADRYIKGLIDDKEFPESFVELSEEDCKRLAQICEDIFENSDFTKADETNYGKMMEIIRDREKSLVFIQLINKLTPDDNTDNSSELNLMKSVIEYELNNAKGGDEKFDLAIQMAPYSDNGGYSRTLMDVSAVINGVATPEMVNAVPEYIEDAYINMLPINSHLKEKQGNDYSEDYWDESDDDYADKEDAEDTSGISDNGVPTKYADNSKNFVNTYNARINISKIDSSKFPSMQFVLQTSNPLNVDNPTITLKDCNLRIDNFSMEEMEFDGSRVVLVCDTSGSMSGSVGELKNAVYEYIESIGDKEEVAIVAFADELKFSSAFSNDKDMLATYVERLDSDGGTYIGCGVDDAISKIGTSGNYNNTIIVLTDGEDGGYDDFNDERLENLRDICDSKQINVYTIGIGGGVNTQYLEDIAIAGNGQSIHCNNTSDVESLYEFIHNQVNNNYLVSFETINQDWSDRMIAVESTVDSAYKDKKYHIDRPDIDTSNGAVITSIDVKKIHKKDTEARFRLIGAGFTEDTNVYVELSGKMAQARPKTEYIDENHISVIIAAIVPPGEYTVTATADNSNYMDKIVIFDKYEEIKYGGYSFEAQTIDKTSERTVLSGDVTMNKFLKFNGDVTLYGDIDNDLSVTLEDTAGSYVVCTEKPKGLLSLSSSDTIFIPSLGEVVIYNDQSHIFELDEYMVEKGDYIPGIETNTIFAEDNGFALYPHKLSLVSHEVCFDFPLQDKIIEYAGGTPFAFKANIEGFIVPAGYRCAGEIEGSCDNIFDIAIKSFYLSKLKVAFDTWNHDYELVAKVKSDDIISKIRESEEDESGEFGFEIGIKGGKWDKLKLMADFKIILSPQPLISVSDFGIGIEGMSDRDQDGSFVSGLVNSTLTGQCDIDLWKLADAAPCLEPILKDTSILKLDDTTIKYKLSGTSMELNTTAKVLGDVEVGNATVNLGEYTYSNYLLGIDKKDVVGLRTKLTVGPKLEFPCFKLTAQQSCEIAINNTYAGYWGEGNVEYDIDILKHVKNKLTGNTLVALYNDYSQVAIIIKGESDLKANKKTGVQIYFDLDHPIKTLEIGVD